MSFNGFSEKTSEFLWGLAFNNEKPWFESHRSEFEKYLRKPMNELASETAGIMTSKYPTYGLNLHVARIYRDARRLHGRGPYKDHLWFSIKNWSGLLEGPMFWFEIGAADYGYGMGFYSAKASNMEEFRKSIDADPRELEKLARRLKRQDTFILEGEEYKRPKGDVGALLNPWYNRKRIGLIHQDNFGGDLFSPKLPEILANGFEFLMPYYEYLMRFV